MITKTMIIIIIATVIVAISMVITVIVTMEGITEEVNIVLHVVIANKMIKQINLKALKIGKICIRQKRYGVNS